MTSLQAEIGAMLTAIVALIRSVLVPILLVTGAVLAVLATTILAGHAGRGWRLNRWDRLVSRYRPVVLALADEVNAPQASEELCRVPARHRPVVGAELVRLLGLTSGSVVDRARGTAERLGLVSAWRRELEDRRWWTRAEAARALGHIRDSGAVTAVIRLLHDPHEEVRAAAAEALGLLGDTRAIPPLVAGLADGVRLQRARVVLALRAFGSDVMAPLVAHGREQPDDTSTVAELLGLVGDASALDVLTAWSADRRPEVRAAALHALGTLGPCDRTYFHALRGLGDVDAPVRAMAARAVARSLRRDAAPYLAGTLDDEWMVAAEGARGLRDLREAGRPWLERALAGPSGELAQQMLWEIDRLAGSPAA